jgi:hypothetical protein
LYRCGSNAACICRQRQVVQIFGRCRTVNLGRQGTKDAHTDVVACQAKGCRSRESNTGLVHGKHEFYH